jgi:hypothetical protein
MKTFIYIAVDRPNAATAGRPLIFMDGTYCGVSVCAIKFCVVFWPNGLRLGAWNFGRVGSNRLLFDPSPVGADPNVVIDEANEEDDMSACECVRNA